MRISRKISYLKKAAMIVVVAFAVTTATVATSVVIAPQAEAKIPTSGVAAWGPGVTYKGLTVRMGLYGVNLYGDGLHVANVRGVPNLNTPVGTLCNWSMTAEFFDTSNHWYKTVPSRTFEGCFRYSHQPQATYIAVNQNVKPGFMCSTLKQNGIRQTSVCMSITRNGAGR
jgi:hypothetical protein